MSSHPYQRLTNHWQQINYEIKFGPSKESQIISLEEKYDIILPEDFRQYLLKSCPEPNGGEMDDNLVSWWSLKRIKNIPDELESNSYKLKINGNILKCLFFADYMIWAWAWAICCDPGENYGRIVYVGGGGRIIANSFSEFVDIYIKETPNFVGCP